VSDFGGPDHADHRNRNRNAYDWRPDSTLIKALFVPLACLRVGTQRPNMKGIGPARNIQLEKPAPTGILKRVSATRIHTSHGASGSPAGQSESRRRVLAATHIQPDALVGIVPPLANHDSSHRWPPE
jgi:hypothetical protein